VRCILCGQEILEDEWCYAIVVGKIVKGNGFDKFRNDSIRYFAHIHCLEGLLE